MTEIWRPIPGQSGYEVSDLGRVLTHKPCRNLPTPRLMKVRLDSHGYPIVGLTTGRTTRKFKVHSLVLLAFVGPRPSGADARHLDGSRDNNRLSNLSWGSRSDNLRDSVGHGTHPQSRKQTCPKGHPFDVKTERQRRCSICDKARFRSCPPEVSRANYRNRHPERFAIRAWAAENGLPVSNFGPIRKSVMSAYLAAHEEAAA